MVHPWIPGFLASRRVMDRPAQVQARSALHALFARAGADQAAAREGVAVFFSFMIGSFVQVAPAVAEHGPTAAIARDSPERTGHRDPRPAQPLRTERLSGPARLGASA